MADEDAHWLAATLLKIDAVGLSPEKPLTWSSGLQAPIYCDNRLTLGYPQIRSRICEMFVERIHREEIHPQLVAGTATAGIPHAAWLADRVDLPLVYVRTAAKGHGREKQVEGHIVAGQKCVLIEDTISTGASLARAARALKDAGLNVIAAISIFSYDFDSARDRIHELGLNVTSLLSFKTLIDVAEETGAVSRQAARQLAEWRTDPEGWSEAYISRMNERI